MRTDRLDVRGVETRVLSAGAADKSAVVLLHGIGLSADLWMPTLRGLADEFSLYAPDLLWHGFTGGELLPRGEAPHTRILEHLEHTADQLGLDQYAVVGSSFGALIGALAYLRRPHRVTRLVIVGSGSCFDNDDELIEMLNAAYRNARRAIEARTWDSWQARLENICFDPTSVPPEVIAPMVTAYGSASALDRFERFMTARLDIELERQHRILDRLDDLRVPICVIWGKQEMRGNIADASKAVDALPDARLMEYDHCGHLPMLERVTRFNEDLRAFLQSA